MIGTYSYSKSVTTMFVVAAVLCVLLVITIPVAIFFFIKSRSAALVLDDRGFTVSGLGSTRRWNFDELERLGTLTAHVIGGGPFVNLNGGATAVNLVARTKAGENLKFMLSRFERWEEILRHVEHATGLPVEAVNSGLRGPAWPKKA